MPRTAPRTETFPAVFAQLKQILTPYADGMLVQADKPDNYYLDAPPTAASKSKVMFFAAAQIKKNYVSYHLMPLYVEPSLLDGISDRLRKRMQGKSCFNFTALDDETASELAGLTRRGFESYRAAGLI